VPVACTQLSPDGGAGKTTLIFPSQAAAGRALNLTDDAVSKCMSGTIQTTGDGAGLKYSIRPPTLPELERDLADRLEALRVSAAELDVIHNAIERLRHAQRRGSVLAEGHPAAAKS
jgi:hypothetical protein